MPVNKIPDRTIQGERMALHKPIDIPLPPTNNWVTKQRVENTVVIFADLSGFQQFAADYGDMTCMGVVEGLFEKFDEFARLHQLTPLKTNGDQYIAVGFSAHPKHILPSSFNTNIHQRASLKESLCRSVRDAVSAAFHFACKARDEVNSHPLLVSSSCYLLVGIATGSVIAGRSSRRFGNFDIWGATVNRAAMLEQFTAPNTIAMCDRSGSLLISPEHNRPLLHGNHLLLYPKYLKTKAEGILAHVC